MVSSKRVYGLTTPFVSVFPDPITKTSAPTTTDKNYPNGFVWIFENGDTRTAYMYGGLDSSGDAVWILAGPGATDVNTLTGDSGGPISPSGGNINILGGDGLTVTGSGSTLTINRDAAGGYPLTPYVVGPSGEAGYTTIQSAINAANAAGTGGMIYIQPGTYTEDLTFYDQIYLVSIPYEDSAPVTIAGTHTPPNSGWITVRGIRFNDATAIFNSAVAGSTNISAEECTFAVTNGYTFNLPNWTGTINCNDCGSAGTNDGFFNNSGGASIFTNNGQFGAGTANAFTANGDTRFDLTFLDCPCNITGGTIFHNFADFSQTMTISGSASGTIFLGNFFPASGEAINTTSSGTIVLATTVINTANNPAIDGTGTITLENVTFGDNSSLAAGLTVTTGSTQVCDSFSTVDAASGLIMNGTSIAASGTDTNIDITLTAKGTGNVLLDGCGLEANTGDDLQLIAAANQDVIVTLGDSAGSNSFIIEALDGTDVFTVDSTGGLTFSALTVAGNFAQTAGTFNVGQDNAANAVNIGGGTTARAIAIANGTGAHTLALGNASAGAATWDTAAGISLDAATASNFTVTGAGQDLTLSSAGGRVDVSATEDSAQAIYLHANGGTSETIQLHADQGTGASSIYLLSDAGGLTFESTGLASADAINLVATAGGIDADAALQINVASSQNAADAIVINASAGGIDITAAGAAGEDLDLTCTSGSVNITAGEDDAGAIAITANGGTSEKVTITAAQGTGVDSVGLTSTAGGITLSAALASDDAINLSASAGGVDIDGALQVNIASSENAADAIVISASAGGIDMTAAGGAAEDIDITCTAGSINITAGESAADSIVIDASGAAGAIQLNSGTGGVVMDSGQTVNVTSVNNAASPYTLLGSDFVIAADTSAGAVTITLPAAPATGRKIVVVDAAGNAAAQNITVSGNGNNIAGGGTLAATDVIDSDYGTMTLYFTGTIWNAQDVA